MEVLRIATAGSVDDGKSTLIGRLLYDTQSITQDKLQALEQASKRKGLPFTDLSLLTDGLIAEREQGITIDVAHIYFSTPTRKYIIADTPGHFEYTRNMVTGASNTKVSLILIDARNGVVEQTYRHFYISNLLRIPQIVVCVNKMDLVNYSENRFNEIVADFQQLVARSEFKKQTIQFIPICSLHGENVVRRGDQTPWYKGESLLEYLEQIEFDHDDTQHPPRFPVQYVIRPKTDEYHDFRGYAGKVSSGSFYVGDEVLVLPTLQKSKIKSIEKYKQSLSAAHARESVVITLEDDVDLSRGNMLVKADNPAPQLKELTAKICWMDHQPLVAGKTYLLQHGMQVIKAKVQQLTAVINVQTLEQQPDKHEVALNDIGTIRIKTAKPVFADPYDLNPANGAFILIDEHSHATVGAGFVL